MKKTLLTLLCAMGATLGLQADVITQWDFNFPTTGTVPATSTPTTGTFTPYIGSGTFTTIGIVTNSFGNPPAGGQTSDPWTPDNSALRIGNFPGATANNKTAGIQFFASTVGYENIQVTWDQENSNTASKYWRTQYSTNAGASWIDYVVTQATHESSAAGASPYWQLAKVVDLSTAAGVKNNPNFGYRMVSEFQLTTGLGTTNSYVGNSPTNGYSANGTLWVDMVTLSGTVLDTSNTDPTISPIGNQTALANQNIGPIAFTVGDAETPAASLTVEAVAANTAMVPTVTVGGSGSNRTLTLTPAPNQPGSSLITVTVTDGGNKGTSTSFTAAWQAPSLVLSNHAILVNSQITAAPFALNGFAAFTGPVTLSAVSSNEVVVPSANVTFGGTGTNRTVTVVPAANQTGGALIVVTATDGNITVSSSFFVNVLPLDSIALWNFNSDVRDNTTQTGTYEPVFGSGLATALVAEGSFGNVSTGFDPDVTDNSRLRLGNTFPTNMAGVGQGNKTAGVEFKINTVGFQDVTLSYYHYNSASCSRFWRVQYATDGVNFVDHVGYSNTLTTTWFSNHVSFAGISGVNNNPNLAVRLVAELSSTAPHGNPTNTVYEAVSGGGHGAGGTLWLDMINFKGSPYNPNSAPVTLSVSRSGNSISISWPAAANGVLQGSATLPGSFTNVGGTPTENGGVKTVTVPTSGTQQYFRLAQ